MGRFWMALGALLAAAAVAAGAMGAHALRTRLDPAAMANFETATRYLMYHAFGLMLAGGVVRPGRLANAAAACFALGALLFSGGLYAWLWSGQKPFVHVVPFGGGIWIVAWLLLAAASLAGRAAPGGPPGE